MKNKHSVHVKEALFVNSTPLFVCFAITAFLQRGNRMFVLKMLADISQDVQC
jgi:hypothetical protein